MGEFLIQNMIKMCIFPNNLETEAGLRMPLCASQASVFYVEWTSVICTLATAGAYLKQMSKVMPTKTNSHV